MAGNFNTMSLGVGSNTGLNSTDVKAATERNSAASSATTAIVQSAALPQVISTTSAAPAAASPALNEDVPGVRTDDAPITREEGPPEQLIFPDTLLQAPAEGSTYPYIVFSYFDNKNNPRDKIFLPLPPGLEISDSMNYNTIDLGIIGDTGAKMISAMADQSSLTKASQAAFSTLMKDVTEKSRSARMTELAAIAARYGPVSSNIETIVNFGSRKILSPNTNTTFQGSNIRRYQFRFKMVAQSRSESETIKKIVDTLRENLYPEGNDLSMEFPGTWQISFCHASGEANNPYLPRVWRCFMSDFSSAYNTSSANMWHEDGSPVDVDISMAFQEVRALRKKDIEDLNCR